MNSFYARTSQMRYALQKTVMYKFPMVLKNMFEHSKVIPSPDPEHKGLELFRYHHEIADYLQSWEHEQFVEVGASHIIDEEYFLQDSRRMREMIKDKIAREIGHALLSAGLIFFEENRPNFGRIEFKGKILTLRNLEYEVSK